MSSPEYVKKPEGMTLEELKECVEWLIEKKWWNQTEYLNTMNISNPPDKLYTYLDSGGRYSGWKAYTQRAFGFREWGISAKVTAKPTEPCLQVLNGLVTIVNSPPPTPEQTHANEGMTMAEAKKLIVGTMVERVDGSDSDRTVCRVPRDKTSTGRFGIIGLFGGRRLNLPQDWKVKSPPPTPEQTHANEGMTMAEAKMLTVGTMVEKVDGSDSDRTVCKVPRVKTSTGRFGITGLFGGRRVNLPQDWKVKSKK